MAEGAVRAELHHVGVPAEVARAHIHPETSVSPGMQPSTAAAAAARFVNSKSFCFSGGGKTVKPTGYKPIHLPSDEAGSSKRTPMRTLAAAAAASSPAGGRRHHRGSAAVRCSSSAEERQALFSRIAPVYDHLNDVLSLGQHRTWKRICVSWSMAKRGDRVLDLCCGSGDLAFLLSQKVGLDGEVMAVDFSRQQLQTAASRRDQRWKPCYKNIKWIEGDALDLPFTECYFDAVTVGYGLRNVVDKSKAMREIFRVLTPGSRASILDFNKSSSFFTASLQSWAIDNVVVPLASGYGLTEEYKYLKSSISQYLTGEELEKLAKESGFSSANHYELGGGLMGNLVATR